MTSNFPPWLYEGTYYDHTKYWKPIPTFVHPSPPVPRSCAFLLRLLGHRMTIGWGKPINKLVNAVGVETKIESEAPPPDVLDPGLPESLQKLTPEAKASLQKVRFSRCTRQTMAFSSC